MTQNPERPAITPNARVPLLPEEGGGLGRVIKDTDVQYVIDVLVNVSMTLCLNDGVFVGEFADDLMHQPMELNHRLPLALIDTALRKLGVDPFSSLEVRQIHPDNDLLRVPESTEASEAPQ